MISIARYDTFCFVLPLIQSTTVLLSPRTANSIPSTVLGCSITKGSSSLSFLRGKPPSIFLTCNGDKWMSNISVGIASVFLEGFVLHFCIQSSPDPAHLAIGVLQVAPLSWKPHLCFQQVTFNGSHFMPHALLFLHYAVVLLQHQIVVLSEQGPHLHKRPRPSSSKLFEHTILPKKADPISSTWYAASSSANFVCYPLFARLHLGSEGQGQNLCFPAMYHTFVVTAPCPIRAAVQCSAEDMADHPLAFRIQRNTFRAVNISVAPPATYPFAQRRPLVCLSHHVENGTPTQRRPP